MHRLLAAALLLGLAACASAPVQPPAQSLTTATPAQMVEYVHAAAGDGEGELNVQPLRNSEVEDLRQQAERLLQAGHHADAAAALDHAITLVSDDPALLQERAEVALLLSDFASADELATRAQALGSGVGPLCRRHWATREQVRLVQGDAAGAAAAKEAMAVCRVAPPPRW
ncbi:hypothetical protein [Luteimonas terricola]|uniref:Tetratricopeptide repeat protein n=1 Tax=Luteimonas terricola TaxID=645597 RepID=A0ABQ2E8P5_9GAMM|nr:hypothetical protein [Luteimonas terricola]GGK00046.1 hypothetical protein GCM10011394_06570 [Luteimonas terricola]